MFKKYLSLFLRILFLALIWGIIFYFIYKPFTLNEPNDSPPIKGPKFYENPFETNLEESIKDNLTNIKEQEIKEKGDNLSGKYNDNTHFISDLFFKENLNFSKKDKIICEGFYSLISNMKDFNIQLDEFITSRIKLYECIMLLPSVLNKDLSYPSWLNKIKGLKSTKESEISKLENLIKEIKLNLLYEIRGIIEKKYNILLLFNFQKNINYKDQDLLYSKYLEFIKNKGIIDNEEKIYNRFSAIHTFLLYKKAILEIQIDIINVVTENSSTETNSYTRSEILFHNKKLIDLLNRRVSRHSLDFLDVNVKYGEVKNELKHFFNNNILFQEINENIFEECVRLDIKCEKTFLDLIEKNIIYIITKNTIDILFQKDNEARNSPAAA